MYIKYLFYLLPFTFTNAQWVQNENATQTTAGNLVMENVPAIPQSTKEKTRQYSNIRSASFRSWSLDGKSMIMATGFGETTQLHRVDRPLGQRSQITFFNEPVRGGYYSKNQKNNGFLFSKDNRWK